MKSHGLTLTSCLAVLSVAAFWPSVAMAYNGPSPTPPVRMEHSPSPPPAHANPTAGLPGKTVGPLYLQPPRVVTPDHGLDPSA